MKYFVVFAVAFLFSLHSLGQIKTNYIDSLGVSVADIKEELLKIKENYYVIMPYGITSYYLSILFPIITLIIFSNLKP